MILPDVGWNTWRRPYPADAGMILAAVLVPVGLLGIGLVSVWLVRYTGRWSASPAIGFVALYGISAVLLVYSWRFCRVGLYVDERGLLVRYMTATRRLDWASVRRIETARIRLGGGELFLAVLIVPTRGRRPLIAPVWCRIAGGRANRAVRADGSSARYVRRISFEAYQDMVEVLRAYQRRYVLLERAVRAAEVARG